MTCIVNFAPELLRLNLSSTSLRLPSGVASCGVVFRKLSKDYFYDKIPTPGGQRAELGEGGCGH